MTHYPDTTTEPTEHTRQSAAADHSELTDAKLAYAGVMARRGDLDLTRWQYSMRNRILKLSAQLWDLRQSTSERISELLRFNNEFEDRSRKAERSNSEMFDLGFRAAGGQVLPIVKVDGVITAECMDRLQQAWKAIIGGKIVSLPEAVRTLVDQPRDLKPTITMGHARAARGTKWRHKNRGTFYEVDNVANLQFDSGLSDGEPMVIYRSLADDTTWVRSVTDFEDGRFEPVRTESAAVCGCGVNCQDYGPEGGCRYFTKPLDHGTVGADQPKEQTDGNEQRKD